MIKYQQVYPQTFLSTWITNVFDVNWLTKQIFGNVSFLFLVSLFSCLVKEVPCLENVSLCHLCWILKIFLSWINMTHNSNRRGWNRKQRSVCRRHSLLSAGNVEKMKQSKPRRKLLPKCSFVLADFSVVAKVNKANVGFLFAQKQTISKNLHSRWLLTLSHLTKNKSSYNWTSSISIELNFGSWDSPSTLQHIPKLQFYLNLCLLSLQDLNKMPLNPS